MISEDEKYRYSRHLLLNEVGISGQEKLKAARVLVIGAGGLGCPILLYLSAAGVGTIGVVDFDHIDETNLQRQILFDTADVGKSKAEVAQQKLISKNPFITINAYNFTLNNGNAIELFKQYDIIIDGTDNFSTRYLVNDACILTNKPLVYGSIQKFEGQVSVFNYENGPTYRCLFPSRPLPDTTPSCSEVGVLGILPGIIGAQQANEALKIILGLGGVLSGRLLLYNALKARQTEITLIKNFDLKTLGIETSQDFENHDYSESCDKTSDIVQSISNTQFLNLKKDSLVIDVREDWEQPKIKHLEVTQISISRIDEIVDQIPKDKNVYVICQKGNRSLTAIDYLTKKYNFKNLINIDNGLEG